MQGRGPEFPARGELPGSGQESEAVPAGGGEAFSAQPHVVPDPSDLESLGSSSQLRWAMSPLAELSLPARRLARGESTCVSGIDPSVIACSPLLLYKHMHMYSGRGPLLWSTSQAGVLDKGRDLFGILIFLSWLFLRNSRHM